MYYGSDGTSTSFPSCGSRFFYIGRMGIGTTSNGVTEGGYFNQTLADTAYNQDGIWGYWYLLGPAGDPNNNYTTAEAYTWGQTQAKATAKQYYSIRENYYVGIGETVYGDVESGSTWLPYNQSYSTGYTGKELNQKVWEGWYNEMNTQAVGNSGPYPGLYTNETWYSIMGNATPGSFGVASGTPLWWASWIADGSTPPACPTSLNENVASPDIPGALETFWQYYSDQPNGSTPDYDAATTLS